MEETTTARPRTRWRALALIGGFSVLLAQFIVWAGPAAAQAPGDELYAADGAGGNDSTTLYKVNPATGAKTEVVGAIGFSVTGLAFDPTTGVLYGSTTSQDDTAPGSLIRINQATGAGTFIGEIIAGCDSGTVDITFTTDGQLWGISECGVPGFGDSFVSINKATGGGTQVAGINSVGGGISADPDDNTVWATPDNDDGDYFTIDTATGAQTNQGTLDGDNSNSINSLAWSCDGETLFGTANIDSGGGDREFITINTSTDSITVLGGPEFIDEQQDALAFDCAPPPPVAQCKGLAATIVGTSGNDTLVGTSGRDVVAARGGNDGIASLGGNDVVCAGAGKDRANGGAGKDKLRGQGGNDRLRGAGGKDNLRGGGGRDRCNGGPGADTGNCEVEGSMA